MRGAIAVLAVLCVGLWLAALPAVAAVPAAGKPADLPASPVPSLIDADGNRLSDDLDALLAGGLDPVAVVVRLNAAVSDDALAALQALAGPFQIKARWPVALPDGFATSLAAAQIRALAAHPSVFRIEPDRAVEAFLNTATYWTGVRQAWADFGADGDRDGNKTAYSRTDVVVAILDTGIDAGHVDLDAGKVIGWYDVINGRTSPYDDHGHGTHVASITAGTGEGNADYTGVAPGAALVGIKVLDRNGSGTTSGIISGIDWMIRNKDTYGIRAGNMSLGSSGCSDGTDSLSSAVNNAVDNGIVMVVAAGNSGPNKCTVGSPAAAARGITVGAMYDPGEKGWVVAEFSSRGPTADGRIKPDIAAPGRYITAAEAGSGNGYVTYSGTSMATPFVAGVVALMLDADYSLTDTEVKAILFDAANVKDFGPAVQDVDYGFGITVAYNAVKAAGGFTGSFSDGLGHRFAADSLPGTGYSDYFSFSVSDASKPVGIAMIMDKNPSCFLWICNPDFDIYLYDPSGKLVASSEGIGRQEQILYLPAVTGTYTLEVYSYYGSGSYTVDVSFR